MSDSEENEQMEEEEQVEDLENLVENEEEEDENQATAAAEGGESDDEEFAGFGEEEIKQTKKIAKRKVLSDDEGEEEVEEEVEQEEEVVEEVEQQEEEQVEEENQQVAEENQGEEVEQQQEEEEEEEEVEERKKSKKKGDKKSDLEEAIEKHKSKKKHRRKNDDSEALTNIDNTIALLVTEMKAAAADDRAANEKRVCSIRKLKMLEVVTNMLQKAEHHATMIELGMLGAIAEWLAPLPDRSLPNIKIREILINALQEFGEINSDYLKSSGIGKAVMFLYKHPKETKPNKEKLEKIIHEWARPIFSLDSNFKGLSKEERQQRDMEHVKALQRRVSNEDSANNIDIDEALDEQRPKSNKKLKTKETDDPNQKGLKPGDPNFCPRARVPIPSQKDYIIRPKSNLDNVEMQEKKSKKSESRLDKHKKRFVEIKKQSKLNKAVLMSIEGRKLPL